ncbi:MAG: toxin-antitoxin system HicB family antitoxin [Cyanobacteria bacterium P01_D01_bin.123]
MATLTIRLPDDKEERLAQLAKSHGISINKLIEEPSTIAIAEFDAKTRFKAMAAMGNSQMGLEILNKLDALTTRSPEN